MKTSAYAFMALLLAALAGAMPPLPHEVYGTLEINGAIAQKGQNISIYDEGGVMCGSQLTKYDGLYGLVSCRGDDIETGIDEGAMNGEKITLFVNGQEYEKLEWQSARFTNENISIIQHKGRFEASIKIPISGKEKAMLAFLIIAAFLLGLSISLLKKAIRE